MQGNHSKPSSVALPACVAKKCYEYEGVMMATYFTAQCLMKTRQFQVRKDDVFIITYPKTGTTWAQMAAFLINCDGDTSKLDGNHLRKLVPFLEAPLENEDLGKLPNAVSRADVADAMPRDTPRILKTHIQPRFLPAGIDGDDPKAKVIFVARNPKDTAASFFHFCQLVPVLPKYESWQEFFEEFCIERVPYGSWFDMTLYWWRLRNHPNVLFLTYEDMILDRREATFRIMKFMGKSLSDDVINKITDLTSFDAMKSSPNTNISLEGMDTSQGKNFFRKGRVGDWRHHFTVDQNDRFDRLYRERMAESGLKLRFE